MNSRFTKSIVEGVWKGIGGEKGVGVVYPCVAIKETDETENVNGEIQGPALNPHELWKGKKVVLSINRFERKKDVDLAIKALAGMDTELRKGVRLVIAGKRCQYVLHPLRY